MDEPRWTVEPLAPEDIAPEGDPDTDCTGHADDHQADEGGPDGP